MAKRQSKPDKKEQRRKSSAVAKPEPSNKKRKKEAKALYKPKPPKPPLLAHLTNTEEAMPQPYQRHRIGIEIPLSDESKPGKDAADRVERLVQKMIGRGGAGTLHQPAFSINRIFVVRTSELFGQALEMRDPDRHVLAIKRGVQQLARSRQLVEMAGWRFVLLCDQRCDPTAMSFLVSLHYATQNTWRGGIRPMLRLSNLIGEYPVAARDPRLIAAPSVFQILYDLPRDATNYLSYCLVNQLNPAFDLRKVGLRWVKDNKMRLKESLQPLLVIKAKYKFNRASIDDRLASLAPLTKYTSVLVTHSDRR